jgi:glucose-6-phosphate 1-dehydrogenase
MTLIHCCECYWQTSELVDRFLRVRRREPTADRAPFLRVVIEKPFGTSTESAQALAIGLKHILRVNKVYIGYECADSRYLTLSMLVVQDDEVYLMDHYAGKPGVRAWRSYLELNRELLRPLWSSRSIRNIEVRVLIPHFVAVVTKQGSSQCFINAARSK